MSEVIRLSAVEDNDFPDVWYGLAAESHFWFVARMAAFVAQMEAVGVPLDEELLGLEVGCGTGVVRRQLEARTAWVVDGADVNETPEMAAGVRGRTFVYDVHEHHPEMLARYDFLVLFDIIEHLDDAHAFLEACVGHLKPGGLVFVNVPALELLRSRYDTVVGHRVRHDRRSLAATLEGAGLEVVDQRYWGLPMVPLLLVRRLLPARHLADEEVVIRGFRPPAPWLNRLLLTLSRVELSLPGRSFAGTSLLAVARARLRPSR